MNSKTAKNHSSDLLKDLLESVPAKQRQQTKRKMLLAAKIDDGLKAKGWTKTDLAEKLGKYPSEVTKWLSGTHNFTVETLWDIEDILDIKLVDLDKKAPEVIQTLRAVVVAQYSERYMIDPPIMLGAFANKPHAYPIISYVGSRSAVTDAGALYEFDRKGKVKIVSMLSHG